MSFGAVWIRSKEAGLKKQRLRSHQKELKSGMQVELYLDEKALNFRPQMEPYIIHKGQGFDIWYKPSGWLSQGSPFGDKYSLLRYAEVKRKKAYLVHRLDREVSGLLLIASNAKIAAYFSQNWTSKVKKFYQAEVLGKITSANSFEINSEVNGKTCQTWVTPLKVMEKVSKIEIEIITGRKHQIRLHLLELGHPIIGDPSYGTGNKNTDGIQLIAHRLLYEDPGASGKLVEIILPEKYRIF